MGEKIGIALIGCGGMGNTHLANLGQAPDAQIVALCDIRREALEKTWKERFKGDPAIRLYDSMDQLLADPPASLQAVLIATPHTTHFGQAMASLDKGWDVLLEKPMVTSSADARALAEKVKSSGRQLQVAFQASYSAEFAYIRKLIQEGGLGELQTISAHSCQGWRPRGEHRTWRHDPKFSGGGQMYDTGAHLFNAIAWLIDRPAIEVFCWTDNKGMEVDINAVMTIRWAAAPGGGGGEVLGSVTISGNTPGWQEGIVLSGDKGRISTGIQQNCQNVGLRKRGKNQRISAG